MSRLILPLPRRVAPFWSKSRIIFPLALVLSLLWPGSALAQPKVHTVYSGQRLGSIAKRYNVSVDELCKANGISRKDPIHPGQKLIIPGTDDGKTEQRPKQDSTKGQDDKNHGTAQAQPSKPQGKTRVHVVQKGHTLSAIAGRYAITVSSLCYANDLSRNASLSVGQKLIIPHKTDEGGAYARKQRDRGDFDEPHDQGDVPSESSRSSKTDTRADKASWMPFVKAPWRRGFIKIRRYGRYWEGYVIGPKGEVLGHASNKINFVLGARSDGPRIDPTLIRLIASISDKFGGRELRIVSGYRTKSFVAASQHKKGRALDFSIPGIPNEALRDYLRTLDDVGVGYYPNSSFVHLDVRGYNSYWIDYAGPGQAPRKQSKKKSASKADPPPDEAAEPHPDQEPPEDEPSSDEDGTDQEYSHGDPDTEDEEGSDDDPKHAED